MNKLMEQVLLDPSVRNKTKLEELARDAVEADAPWNQ